MNMLSTSVLLKFCCSFIEFLSNPDIRPQAENVQQTISLNMRSEPGLASGECVTGSD